MTNIDNKFEDHWYLRTNESFTLIFLSVIFALAVVLFPWDAINKVGFFEDFLVYEINLEQRMEDPRSIIERYGIDGPLTFFTFEGLWDMTLVRLMYLTDNNAFVSLKIISFLTLLAWGLITFRRLPFWWGVLFLINPTSIDVALSGLRNGFAWSIFALAIFYLPFVARNLLMWTAPFIHSTSIVLIGFYYSSRIWFNFNLIKGKRFFSKKSNAVIIAFLPGTVIGILLAFLSEMILLSIGDRRALIAQQSYDPSLLQALFWWILLFTQLSCSSDYLRKNSLQTNLVSWYCFMNLSISWSSRVWAAAIPFIAISIWNLPKKKRDFILALWVGYLTLWYFYWSNLFYWWNQ